MRALPQLPSKIWLERAAAAAGLPVSEQRVFNMARRCVPFSTSTTTETVLSFPALSPPASSIGIGVLDGSRAAKRGALHATIEGVEGVVIVDDEFLSSSRVLSLPQPRSSVTVRVAPNPRGARGCVWLAP